MRQVVKVSGLLVWMVEEVVMVEPLRVFSEMLIFKPVENLPLAPCCNPSVVVVEMVVQ